MGSRDISDSESAVEGDETYGLIGSDKVEGTPVFGSSEQQIGTIARLMIDKQSGIVAYAVMKIEDMPGDGVATHYPIPWPLLIYNTELGGYEVDVEEDELEDAPKFSTGEDWEYRDRDQEDQLYRYYNTPVYWVADEDDVPRSR